MAANNSLKTSELATAANAASSDRLVIIRDPSGSPSTRTIAVLDLVKGLQMSNTAPATSSSNGVAGTFSYDASYFYLCTANNTWTRVPLNTW